MDSSPRDAQAFRQIFDAYVDPLRRFVYSYVQSWQTAEEIANDAFLQLWMRRRSAKPVREVKAYLYTTARNLAINHLRHQRVEVRHLRESTLSQPPHGRPVAPTAAEQEHELLTRELTAALQRAIDALPPRRREVILLKWERHLSYEEIGQNLGIAPKTVAEHLRRALDQLRTLLPESLRSD